MSNTINLMSSRARVRECSRTCVRQWSRILAAVAGLLVLHATVTWWPVHMNSQQRVVLEAQYNPLRQMKAARVMPRKSSLHPVFQAQAYPTTSHKLTCPFRQAPSSQAEQSPAGQFRHAGCGRSAAMCVGHDSPRHRSSQTGSFRPSSETVPVKHARTSSPATGATS